MKPPRPPLRFLDTPKPCAVCKIPTVTVKHGKGMSQALHVSCDRRPAEELEDREVVELLALISAELGPVRMLLPPRPTQLDVGPCTNCLAPTRRYGEHGTANCHNCDPRKPRLMDDHLRQLPLFPILACDCGHRYPGISGSLQDPCPDCLVSPDDHHDCPLRVEE